MHGQQRLCKSAVLGKNQGLVSAARPLQLQGREGLVRLLRVVLSTGESVGLALILVGDPDPQAEFAPYWSFFDAYVGEAPDFWRADFGQYARAELSEGDWLELEPVLKALQKDNLEEVLQALHSL